MTQPIPQHLFVALYAGDMVGNARIMAASADPNLVNVVKDALSRGDSTRRIDPAEAIDRILRSGNETLA